MTTLSLVPCKTQKAASLSLMLSSTKVINKSKNKIILSNHERISQLSSLLVGEQSIVNCGHDIWSIFQSFKFQVMLVYLEVYTSN